MTAPDTTWSVKGEDLAPHQSGTAQELVNFGALIDAFFHTTRAGCSSLRTREYLLTELSPSKRGPSEQNGDPDKLAQVKHLKKQGVCRSAVRVLVGEKPSCSADPELQ